jgi:glycerol kinase
MGKYSLALDQGTTSSRAILFDEHQNMVGTAQREFAQLYPREGWVEHDPMEIYSSQYAVMMELITAHDISAADIAAIGITNQRETTILWDAKTGRPVYNAIVWQCRRTSDIVDALVRDGLGEHIRKTTGLVPDAYFSGTKIKWILDHVEGARERAQRGEVLFGTVDTWLIWKLTNGAVHVIDYTNASRTMIFDIHELDWDATLLQALDIPRQMLPEVRPSSAVYGKTNIQGIDIPIAGDAGDQQAALFGQCCFGQGEAKNTYGTGCFLLMNTGAEPYESRNGLLTTIAASLPGKVQYVLEGSVFVGGAVIQWLRDEMRFITESPDAEYYAGKVEDTGGVYLVPAFTGLGAPHWDMYARGCIVGITRGTKRYHIIRAAEEAIAYQSLDLIRAMEKDTALRLSELKVDGGATRDRFLMQFQADIMGGAIRRPVIRETTALGAAYLAGIAVGFWKNLDDVRSLWRCDAVFKAEMAEEKRRALLEGWHKAVGRSRDWASQGPVSSAER